MDIIGVPGITAEAELLSAIVTFFKRVGFTSDHITIRVNSRKVLQAVLDKLKVTGDKFMPTCIVIDKLDKLSREEIIKQLKEIGLPDEAITGILDSITIKSLEELGEKMGKDTEAFKELSELFALAEAYGFREWLQFDASVIRGLSYYTGIVFEGIAKTGGLTRAICGGGRYDRLFEMFGASKKEQQPCCGFGFGDIVVLEILKDNKLVPKELEFPEIDDLIVVQADNLFPAAMQVAGVLRSKRGRAVDVLLTVKKRMDWVFNYAGRMNPKRLVLLGQEWEKDKSVAIIDMLKDEKAPDRRSIVKFEDL